MDPVLEQSSITFGWCSSAFGGVVYVLFKIRNFPLSENPIYSTMEEDIRPGFIQLATFHNYY